MPNAAGGMAILPQFQGSYYDLQRQQALAQALMQNSLTPQQSPQGAPVGGYQVTGRVSPVAGLSQLGQALLAAKTGQDVSQGYNQLGQQQWAMLTGGNPAAGMGASGSPLPSAPAGQPGVNDGSAGASGVSDQLSQQPAPQQQGMLAPGGPMNPLGMPVQQAAMEYFTAPDKYWEAQNAAYKPADIVAQLRSAGIDPNSPLGKAVGQQALAKALYQAPTSIRGQFYSDMNGIHALPAAAPEGYQQVPDGRGGFQIVPQQGGPQAVQGNAAAKAGGQAQYQLTDVWDPTANGGQGGMVRQTVSNASNAANGTPGSAAIPQIESRGNPNAVSPKGAVGAWQVMPNTSANPGFGVQPAANNSRAELDRVGQEYYGAMQQRYGDPALAAVAYNMGPGATDKWLQSGGDFAKLPQQTQLYLGRWTAANAVNGRAGAQPGAAPTAPTGPQPAAAPTGGPMASQPPLGLPTAANASQGAPSELMSKSYGSLSSNDSNYQASREALQTMIGLAQKAGPVDAASRFIPEGVATRLDPAAAEYEKQYANYVSLQGKALGGESSGGTDQSRGMLANSVPSWDKPQAAKISGLNTQLQQLDMNHIKTQFLTPIYQKGDEKTYTAQSAAFDQNIKPSMTPILQMSGPQQQAAVRAAIRANPSLRPSFEWAFNNGFLK